MPQLRMPTTGSNAVYVDEAGNEHAALVSQVINKTELTISLHYFESAKPLIVYVPKVAHYNATKGERPYWKKIG